MCNVTDGDKPPVLSLEVKHDFQFSLGSHSIHLTSRTKGQSLQYQGPTSMVAQTDGDVDKGRHATAICPVPRPSCL